MFYVVEWKKINGIKFTFQHSFSYVPQILNMNKEFSDFDKC